MGIFKIRHPGMQDYLTSYSRWSTPGIQDYPSLELNMNHPCIQDDQLEYQGWIILNKPTTRINESNF